MRGEAAQRLSMEGRPQGEQGVLAGTLFLQ